MVKVIQKDDKNYYQCGVCGMKYKEKEIAEKCEAWCREHPNSCDPEVTEHAIQD